MKVLGVTAHDNEMKGNYHKGTLYDTLMNYFVLEHMKIDKDTSLCLILKDVQFKTIAPSKKEKRARLRNVIRNNHIKKVIK